MEKIILALDALNPDRNAFDFACYLGRLTRSKITGVFLENMVDEARPVVKDLQGRTIIYRDDSDSNEYSGRKEKIEKNIAAFKDGCINREVCFHFHRDRGRPAAELIEESRFADVLIISSGTSFNKQSESSPTGFVKEIIQNAECPVIIAPESFEALEEIVFAYNGSASSVFAIKQFTYLFPQLHNKKITILQVNNTGVWQDPEKHKFHEWLDEHYVDLHFEALKGNADDKLFDYLFNRKDLFLVMGAYGRNALSRFFKSSHADPLIKFVSQPIFITHY